VALRRTAVGPFSDALAVGLKALPQRTDAATAVADPSVLRPVELGLGALPALTVSRADAARLASGQAVLLRGRDAPIVNGWVSVSAEGRLVALAQAEQGELRPRRIFNLSRPTR
jgi:tRNA pseudouridine55 synthase